MLTSSVLSPSLSRAPTHVQRVARLAAAAFLACSITACASIPAGRQSVASIDIEGVDALDSDDVHEAMATRESERGLGIWQGFLHDYSLLSVSTLERDLARIERFYARRGFYDADVYAGRVRLDGDEAEITVLLREGAPVTVASVVVDGLDELPPEVSAAALKAARERLPVGERFDEDAFAEAEAKTRFALTDRGYAFATVTRDAVIDVAKHRAIVRFVAAPDLPCVLGPVAIEGAGELSEDVVRNALGLEEGAPYSTRDFADAEEAIFELGVFAAVTIEPVLAKPPPTPRVVPVRVRLTPAKLRKVRLGGGAALDAIKSDVHLLIGWEDKNFLGGARHFSIEARPSVVLYALRLNNFVAPTHPLVGGDLRMELSQAALIERRTRTFVRPSLTVAPVLLKTDTNDADPVVGYAMTKGSVGAVRAFSRLLAELSTNLQHNAPFAYLGALDPALTPIVIFYPELALSFDFRDDRVHPHRGFYAANTLQVAFGGDAHDVKVQPEIRGYLPLGRHLTVAARSTVGFLFPQNYGGNLEQELAEGFDGPERAARIHDLQLLYFRSFFSGGPSSNRGYPYQGVGPHGVVPYLNPQAGACDPTRSDFDRTTCLTPVGGLSLWEASLELRWAVTGPFETAVFCDASDLSPSVLEIRPGHPHVSCGLGVRYDTPVGPLRLDVGYRIPGLQVLGGPDPLEKEPSPLFGVEELPIAVSIGVGEAF